MPLDRNQQAGTSGFSGEADRSQPPCPHFGPCGGCQLQDLTYAAQLALKAARLRALLAQKSESSSNSTAEASASLPELQLHPSPPLAYRNRIRLTLAESSGVLRAGYIAQPAADKPATSFLPISECPIATPILWRAAEALLALINQRSAIWLERAPFTLDQLELFTAADESQLQISLFARTSAKHLPTQFAAAFTNLCDRLRADIPELTGAGISLLPPQSAQRSRRTEIGRPGPTWGAPGLNYTVAQPANDDPQLAMSYWVPRGAFFQVNRFLLPELLALVTANRSGTLAWDLYAGVGLFTKALAPHFDRVTAVEVAEPSFTALTSNKLPNRQAVNDTTLDFLLRAVTDRDRPDLIVLDPPRTGAGAEICGLLARVAAPTVVFVSCSPETLPADLATLTASGYSVAELHLFDLFPQTTHIETVAILTRAKK
jgi:23S rRNA (uracil1939-C5)-methyltransferase